MTARGASAPGKALLCGEYAVLEGAPAVVAAVGRRARATWATAPGAAYSPEVEATLARAVERVGPLPAPIAIDVSALQSEGIKLGLGSSAGAAVAAAGAVFAHHGHRLDLPTVVAEVFSCAFAGHAEVAPAGSGVDVAASAYGGYLRFARQGADASVQSLQPPADLEIRLLWTGTPVRTSELVSKVHRFRERDPQGYREVMDRLDALAHRFVDAFEAGSAAQVVSEGAAYGEAMGALGSAAKAPIVEARLQMANDLARRHGGSAKPSGAGGGDVAVAFFDGHASRVAFDDACLREGLVALEAPWGEPGVRAC